jgi:hypothetical protein
MVATLLPPNSTPLERAAEQAIAHAYDIPVPIREVWDPDSCPVGLLSWLAWAWHVDNWNLDWDEIQQRKAIKEALDIHRHKGTPWSLEQEIANLGYSLVELIPALSDFPLDGTASLDGKRMLGDPTGRYQWAVVIADRGVSGINKQMLSQALLAVSPAELLLQHIYSAPPHLKLNGTCRLNGQYNLGDPLI